MTNMKLFAGPKDQKFLNWKKCPALKTKISKFSFILESVFSKTTELLCYCGVKTNAKL